ncbi:MAG: Asp-tRNA(Asn)/Glu-tRNA(Gln) amidotransferase subunit GatC [Pirellulaceae bacterium]
MPLTNDDVLKVANLAKLEFDEQELSRFTEQMAKIVSFVEKLNEVETEGIDPMSHPLGVDSVLREDVNVPGLTREDALSNAPSQNSECFLVPAVLSAKK